MGDGFEKAMDAIWKELIDRYGQLFLSRYTEDWRQAHVWMRVIKEMPADMVRAGFAKLQKSGMPKQGDYYDLSVDGFIALCPSESELLGLIEFENAWAGVQFHRSRQAPPESIWMMRNAAEHGVIWDRMMLDDNRGKNAARRMYGLLIEHVRDGGELPDIASRKAIEQKHTNPDHDARMLAALARLSPDEQWRKLKEMVGVS